MTTLLISLDEFFSSISLIMLIVALILLVMVIKSMSNEIDELKEKLERHRINLKFLNSCELDHENRLDKLEEALELKEHFDEEPLSK